MARDMAYEAITLALSKHHNVKQFDCARVELSTFLQRYALQNSQRGVSRTFVAVSETDPARVIGYYTLTPAEMALDQVPEPLRKGLPRHPLGGYRLARLAVDRHCTGRGLGGMLLFDAAFRCQQASEQVGGVMIFIDAKDEAAAAFYAKHGATPLPHTPLTLLLPMATVLAALRQR